MNRLLTFTAIAALAVSLGAGCSKATSDSGNPNAKETGVVTDSANTGLKPVAGAAAYMPDAKHGQEIFVANCQGCHGAAGAGGGIGPKLIGEKTRKDQTAAVTWIENPAAPMTKLYPAPLGENDVADVAAYVETL